MPPVYFNKVRGIPHTHYLVIRMKASLDMDICQRVGMSLRAAFVVGQLAFGCLVVPMSSGVVGSGALAGCLFISANLNAAAFEMHLKATVGLSDFELVLDLGQGDMVYIH
ncbi:uncharacterized protein N7477_008504 [Penicillium maclennaniae]|uniref:uncharacterized protein n=1 Tax=Penicillium maclennaniae TaxID=1343394 RepID=UPI00253F7FFF|nr:uncharacterized protein N7477_008504 [Penicillium maclennaniae]KAJ5666056.1 hypothetical protein N7477_008504 [Penicillium maclennaniae]